jgi:hypothetical protein
VHEESGLPTTFTAEIAEFAENAFGLRTLGELGALGGVMAVNQSIFATTGTLAGPAEKPSECRMENAQ